MAEITQLKRHREDSIETQEHEFEKNPKRQKSYTDILSILEEEEEEDEPDQDLSDIFTSLQQELSSDSFTVEPIQINGGSGGGVAGAAEGVSSDECSPTRSNGEDDERVKMMRHLLEASDDELGIPSVNDEEEIIINGGDSSIFSTLSDGMMWEFEDAAANFHYYTLMMQQSELFI